MPWQYRRPAALGKHRRQHVGKVAKALAGQEARNLVDPVEGFLRGTTHLIHDRGPLFTEAFATIPTTRGPYTSSWTRGGAALGATQRRVDLFALAPSSLRR